MTCPIQMKMDAKRALRILKDSKGQICRSESHGDLMLLDEGGGYMQYLQHDACRQLASFIASQDVVKTETLNPRDASHWRDTEADRALRLDLHAQHSFRVQAEVAVMPADAYRELEQVLQWIADGFRERPSELVLENPGVTPCPT